MPPIPQRDDAWLKSAPAAEVTRALDAGELAELLGAPVPVTLDGQAAEGDLTGMTSAQIATAYETGQLDALLGREVASP